MRLNGLVSEDMLGDRDSGREVECERGPDAEGGLDSGKGEALLSIESDDFRWV